MSSEVPVSSLRSLTALSARDEFVSRHIGPTSTEQAEMLSVVGAPDIDELIRQTVPASILRSTPLPLAGPRPVSEVLGELRALADRNRPRVSLIGQGYYGTTCPPVVQRNVLEDPGWYLSLIHI